MVSKPCESNTPILPGFKKSPFLRIRFPSSMSEPLRATSCEGVTVVKRLTLSSIFSAYSTIKTASAPSGIAAPVLISIHFPFSTFLSVVAPASKKSMTSKVFGDSSEAPKLSSDKTANPSFNALSNGGKSILE